MKSKTLMPFAELFSQLDKFLLRYQWSFKFWKWFARIET